MRILMSLLTVRSGVDTCMKFLDSTRASPTEAAIHRRDALLARAREEHWPDSAAAGRLLGSANDVGTTPTVGS